MKRRTQFNYAVNTVKLTENPGPNWYNVVLDINEYLELEGFVYDRALGWINEEVLTDSKMQSIAQKLSELALGQDNFIYMNWAEIGEDISLMSCFDNKDAKKENVGKVSFL